MFGFVALTVFCLAVSSATNDYATNPYKNEVNRALPQNTQQVEGVYSDAEAGRAEQAPPCQRHSQSGASQVDANPGQNVHSAQNKESPYGSAQSAQNENLKGPSNYGNKLNYKYRSPSDVNTAQPALNSANQYNKPNSEYKSYVNTGSAVNEANAANSANQQNVASAPNTPYQASVYEGNLARINNAANTANLAKAVNAAKAANQLKKFKYESENSHPHFNNPAVHQNSANTNNQYGNAENVPNKYQSQNKGASAQLNVANQYKNTLSGNEDDNEDQQYDSLVANSRYDDSRRTNKRQDYGQKNEDNEGEFVEKCQTAVEKNQNKDEDLDTRREQELYRFINHKLNEDYQEKRGNDNSNKANNPAHVKSKNSGYLDNQRYQDEFEAYSPPSGKTSQQYPQTKTVKNQGLNNLVKVKSNDENDDEEDPSEKSKQQFQKSFTNNYGQPENDDDFLQGANNQKYWNSPTTKKQAHRRMDNRVNNYNAHGQSKNYDDDGDDEVQTNVVSKNLPKNSQAAKNSQAGKQNKNFANSQALEKAVGSNSKQQQKNSNAEYNENEADEEDPDKYKSDEDYVEDYTDDFSDLQSRRSDNLQQGQNKPQADCNSEEEAQNQVFKNQNDQDSDVEEVDVTARSGRRQKVLVGEHTRVCYACSSASNPTCLKPNKQTTVKYCHRGHDSCITKVFKANGIDILTRDCGTSCNDNIIPGVTPKYKQCSVCHSDLCNGAFSLNSQNVFFICSLVVVSITKYFM